MPIDPTTAKRVRYDGLETYLDLQLTPGVTTVQFTTVLTADGGAPIATLQADEYLALSILDANYRLSEIVYLTSYTSGALTGTIERGAEGTTADKTHVAGSKVVHAATVVDYVLVQDHDESVGAHPEILEQANAYTDGVMADHVNAPDPHPIYAKKAGDTFTGDVVFSGADKIVTVEGTLRIPAGATLEVLGDLKVTGRFFLNGKEIIVSNTPPSSPAANTVHIQTFG
jgi:hypothetical protein